MKDQYQSAEMEVIDFDATDVINTSDVWTDGTTTRNPNCPNEGPAGTSFL